MNWRVDFEPRALKELGALGGAERGQVLRYLRDRIEGPENPRRFGKALVDELAGYWRYRVGAVRIIARIEDDVLMIMVVKVGNRREIHR